MGGLTWWQGSLAVSSNLCSISWLSAQNTVHPQHSAAAHLSLPGVSCTEPCVTTASPAPPPTNSAPSLLPAASCLLSPACCLLILPPVSCLLILPAACCLVSFSSLCTVSNQLSTISCVPLPTCRPGLSLLLQHSDIRIFSCLQYLKRCIIT